MVQEGRDLARGAGEGASRGGVRPGFVGQQGRAGLTLLLPQVLCILPHPQLGLHTGLRLTQDVLGQSTASPLDLSHKATFRQ